MRGPSGRDRLGELIPPIPRFAWGLALLPLVAFAKGWIPATAELAAALLLALLSGKRIKPLNDALVIALMVVFALLSPRGLVLASWGPFRVTEGSLLDGIERGATIVGLVYLSRASVSASLRLPGRFGSLLAGVFASFNRLMESKQKIDRRNWVASIDAALFALFDPDAETRETGVGISLGPVKVEGPRFAAGVALMALSLAGALAALILSRILA